MNRPLDRRQMLALAEKQQQAQFVCGELDIDNDADWQAYVDGMYSLGLEDWVATQGIEEIAK